MCCLMTAIVTLPYLARACKDDQAVCTSDFCVKFPCTVMKLFKRGEAIRWDKEADAAGTRTRTTTLAAYSFTAGICIHCHVLELELIR
jgi:hypothetical protein